MSLAVVQKLRLLPLFFLIVPSIAVGQAVSFTEGTYSISNIRAHADLNNDGREDLISTVQNPNQFAVYLSTGDGVYASPDYYSLPNGAGAYNFAIGDFNNDGKLDVIVSSDTTTFYEFLNNGNGSLRLQASFVAPVEVDAIAAADINHDGRIDLVFESQTDKTLRVWFGNKDGGFTPGPTTPLSVQGSVLVGDFDGDGKADILSQNVTYLTDHEVLYGDGSGHFQATPIFTDNVAYGVFDVNGDGKMDLIGEPFDFSINGSKYYKTVTVQYGNSTRTFTASQIPLKNCTNGGYTPLVADFNGDGINDLAVVEASDCHATFPDTFNVLLGNGDGTFQPEQAITTFNGQLGTGDVLRINHDSKPDLTLTGADGVFNPATTLMLFTNTTPGNFPTCDAPDSGTGITLCTPTNTTGESTSATFRIGAANQTPGRKVEVWVDGKKLGEELKHAFSYYTFFDGTFNLAAGQHSVTIYSAGWDNLLERQDFPLTVGSNICPAPASPGVNVCSPISNSTITGVQVQASAKVTGTIARMEVWVDGVKKFSTYGINTLNTNVAAPPGPHRFDFYAVNTAGAKWETTKYATVE